MDERKDKQMITPDHSRSDEVSIFILTCVLGRDEAFGPVCPTECPLFGPKWPTIGHMHGILIPRDALSALHCQEEQKYADMND